MINVSIFLVGFTAMASQIVLMRELLIVFYGNELSIGFILAGWLIGGSIGSLLFGKRADSIRAKISLFSISQLILSIMLPLSLVESRLVKDVFHMATGEIMSFLQMAVSSFAILLPVCIVLGSLFTLGCSISNAKINSGAQRIGNVFVMEALGSTLGGLIASFICMRFMGSFVIIGSLSALNALGAFILQSHSDDNRLLRSAIRISAAAILILGLIMLGTGKWDALDRKLVAKKWQGYELLASRNSIYGTIELIRRGDQVSFFDNGLHLYTVPDKMAAEEAVSYALLEHPDPKTVLLIGGGVGGLAGEILKHPVEILDYVELDPLIIEMAHQYLPEELYRPLTDPRVSIKNVDGRFFVKNTAQKYDCIIVNLGDPYTAGLNRFYTLEFFKEVKRILSVEGIFACTLTSSESYINIELGDYLRSIYATLSEVFKNVKMIPGNQVVFLASSAQGKDALTYDYKVLEERARSRLLDLQFVRDYYLVSKLSKERTDYIEHIMKVRDRVNLNLDFWPVSYYHAAIFWSSYFRDSLFTKILSGIRESAVWMGLAVMYIAIIISGFLGRRRPNVYKTKGVALAILTAGLTGMAFQVILVLAFQMIYGYVFYKLGMILTAFMVGLSFGGWWMTRILPRLKNCRIIFMCIQICLVIYPAAALLIFHALAAGRGVIFRWIGSNIIFMILPVLAGLIGGMQFPLANRMLLGDKQGVGKIGGYTYGVDLLGASIGATLAGAFLIPIVGMAYTCLAITLLNGAVLLVLMVNNYESVDR